MVNTGINAYKDIQLSHDRVRIVQAQVGAYVESKREETHQVQIQQEQETVRYLASLKADLEKKRIELQKFQMELADRREEREFSREKWRATFEPMRGSFDYLQGCAEELWKQFRSSGYKDGSILKSFEKINGDIAQCRSDLVKFFSESK